MSPVHSNTSQLVHRLQKETRNKVMLPKVNRGHSFFWVSEEQKGTLSRAMAPAPYVMLTDVCSN